MRGWEAPLRGRPSDLRECRAHTSPGRCLRARRPSALPPCTGIYRRLPPAPRVAAAPGWPSLGTGSHTDEVLLFSGKHYAVHFHCYFSKRRPDILEGSSYQLCWLCEMRQCCLICQQTNSFWLYLCQSTDKLSFLGALNIFNFFNNTSACQKKTPKTALIRNSPLWTHVRCLPEWRDVSPSAACWRALYDWPKAWICYLARETVCRGRSLQPVFVRTHLHLLSHGAPLCRLRGPAELGVRTCPFLAQWLGANLLVTLELVGRPIWDAGCQCW